MDFWQQFLFFFLGAVIYNELAKPLARFIMRKLSNANQFASCFIDRQEAASTRSKVRVCCGCGRTKEEIARVGHLSRQELINLHASPTPPECQQCGKCGVVGVLMRGVMPDGSHRCRFCPVEQQGASE
jgi:hypothetical protein